MSGSVKLLPTTLSAAMLLHAVIARADASSFASMFSFDGFGTLAAVHSSDHQADFVSTAFQGKGAGFTNDWSATPDSKLGIQLTAKFTDRLSAVVQALSHYQPDGTFRPDLEWANLKYQLTDDLDIRAGRIVLPTFLYSESVNVGYALPYVRIPLEIYGQLPVSHSDGVDASYRSHVDDWVNTIQLYAGTFASEAPNNGQTRVRQLIGIVDTIERDAVTLHLSYQTLRYDVEGFNIVYARGNPQTIISAGANYDPGRWFISGEAVRAPDDAFGLYWGWNLLGGYRLGQFTPYVGSAGVSMSHGGTSAYPPYINQQTNTLGVRWDFARHMDLKAQFDRTRLHGGSNGFFADQQPGFDGRDTVNILSLNLDVVF